MRGSNQNKAIYNCNKQLKKTLFIGEALFNILILAFYGYNKCYDYIKFLLVSLPEIICILLILRIARPTLRKENNTTVLVDPGTDLTGKGVPSLLFDALVVCMLTKILVVFSYLWLFIYLLIPVSMGYEFIYKPYRSFNKYD